MEYGKKSCTKEDLDIIDQYIPADHKQYIKTSGTNVVETHKMYGTGCYQGYDVIKIDYQLNVQLMGNPKARCKIFANVHSKYSKPLDSLVQVSVIVYY